VVFAGRQAQPADRRCCWCRWPAQGRGPCPASAPQLSVRRRDARDPCSNACSNAADFAAVRECSAWSEPLALLRSQTLTNSHERAAEVWGSRGRRFKSCHPDWDEEHVRGRFREIGSGLCRVGTPKSSNAGGNVSSLTKVAQWSPRVRKSGQCACQSHEFLRHRTVPPQPCEPVQSGNTAYSP
jgi:hypothetical protein